VANLILNCPECKAKVRAPESALGKKIRCSACEHVFVAKQPGKAGPPEKKKPEPAKAKPPEPAKSKQETLALQEDEDNPEFTKKAYGVTGGGEVYRCPQCAAEMEGPEAVVCLECGFNTRTRSLGKTKKVKEAEASEKFLWLLPGVLCVLAIIVMITYWCIHHFAMPGWIWDNWKELSETKTRGEVVGDEKIRGWYSFFFHPGIELWILIMFAFACYYSGKFAYKRLILEPNPPEKDLK
jgi:predicted Zn finger-like uncharacterized protein